MPSSHRILCRPLLLLPPIPPSIRVFSNESTLRMRCPKHCRFSFSIIPSKEIPGLISFRMDWLDLLAVQGTLKGRRRMMPEAESEERNKMTLETVSKIQKPGTRNMRLWQPFCLCLPQLILKSYIAEMKF